MSLFKIDIGQMLSLIIVSFMLHCLIIDSLNISRKRLTINNRNICQMSSSCEEFILGSGSSTRKLILHQNGYKFEVFKADIDEKSIGDRSNVNVVHDLVVNIAIAKADAIIKILPDSMKEKLLLTADQVVVCNGYDSYDYYIHGITVHLVAYVSV